MRDLDFYEIIISGEDHRLIKAEDVGRSIINCDTFTPMEDYIAPEYRDNFVKNIEKCDDKWFPSRIINDEEDKLYYVRASRKKKGSNIRLLLVDIDDLMNTYHRLNREISAFKAQINLFEDVFFEYNPKRETVNVYNTELATFDSGVYSLTEFEKALLKNADEKQTSEVKSFISQIKAKSGRITMRLDGNLLNDDANVTHTVLEEAFVLYDKESEGVVGHIHLGRAKVRKKGEGIKRDSLTGLVDKSDIIRIAKERIEDRRQEGTTLAIIDIDYFKNVNDTYGHQRGDDVIKKIADIVTTEVGDDGIAGRFGGDEFLVVLYNIQDEDSLREKLKNIKNRVSKTFPEMGPEEHTPLSVSIGTASFIKDADSYDDLFLLADYCLYIAKSKGRNRYVIYTPSKHGSLETIRLRKQSIKKINERDLSYGDILVKMFDMTLHGTDSSIEHYMDEFSEAFELNHMSLFVGEPFIRRYTTGTRAIRSQEARDYILSLLNSEDHDKYFDASGFMVVNRLESMPPYAGNLKKFLQDIGVYSYIMIRFYDNDKRECVLIIASVGQNTLWNQMHFKYYRAFTDLMALHSLG